MTANSKILCQGNNANVLDIFIKNSQLIVYVSINKEWQEKARHKEIKMQNSVNIMDN